MKPEIMFSSKTNEWATPLDVYNKLDAEFHFNLDPCATDENHKCEKYFTKNTDGLAQNWGGTGSFAILRMARSLKSGLKKHIEKDARMTHLLCY